MAFTRVDLPWATWPIVPVTKFEVHIIQNCPIGLNTVLKFTRSIHRNTREKYINLPITSSYNYIITENLVYEDEGKW